MIFLHDLGDSWGFLCQPFQFCKSINLSLCFLWRELVSLLLPMLLAMSPLSWSPLLPLTLARSGHSHSLFDSTHRTSSFNLAQARTMGHACPPDHLCPSLLHGCSANTCEVLLLSGVLPCLQAWWRRCKQTLAAGQSLPRWNHSSLQRLHPGPGPCCFCPEVSLVSPFRFAL